MQPNQSGERRRGSGTRDDCAARRAASIDKARERFAEGGFFHRHRRRVQDFWERVTDGLEIERLWSQFVAEAKASYSLYAREVDWETLRREPSGKRFLKTARALFWAMILKLSPARRVFLLLALVLAVLSLLQFQFVEAGKTVHPVGSNPFQLPAIGALLVLLALELADRVIMKRDLEIAREIQHWLVPTVPPRVPGVDIAFTSRPANTVGGDYYDAFLHGDGEGPRPLLLVVADVAGKSVPAALLMATFQASLRSLATAPTSLRELVGGLNRYACAHSLGGRRFTTACFAEFDTATHALTYIRAGHNSPLILRVSGDLERLEIGDLPLGIDPSVSYTCGATTLGSGDLLLIFTDGLVEAVNSIDEEFGEARLINVLKVSSTGSAEGTLKSVLASVDAFAGVARQHDDITCLVLRVD